MKILKKIGIFLWFVIAYIAGWSYLLWGYEFDATNLFLFSWIFLTITLLTTFFALIPFGIYLRGKYSHNYKKFYLFFLSLLFFFSLVLLNSIPLKKYIFIPIYPSSIKTDYSYHHVSGPGPNDIGLTITLPTENLNRADQRKKVAKFYENYFQTKSMKLTGAFTDEYGCEQQIDKSEADQGSDRLYYPVCSITRVNTSVYDPNYGVGYFEFSDKNNQIFFKFY